ncbi:hypothetical protein BHM03_00012709 [Ensete ventricosum]|nr:hypothetical protein BHM03_00012709 [Ensete ventricosum]
MLPLRFPNSGTRAKVVGGRHPQRRYLQARRSIAREMPPEGSGAYRRGSRPWVGRPPMAHSPAASTRAEAAATTQMGQEGLGQFFCENDDPTSLNSGNYEDRPRV